LLRGKEKGSMLGWGGEGLTESESPIKKRTPEVGSGAWPAPEVK